MATPILVQIGQSFRWARAATDTPLPHVDETMRVTDALLLAEHDAAAARHLVDLPRFAGARG
jgi:hypothetical protein